MSNKSAVRWIEAVCSVLACVFLLYKAVSYTDYPLLFSVWEHRASWGWSAGCCACLLLPFNLLCESLKWRGLLKPLGNRSVTDALKDVCKGYLGAFITPNRVGEFPCRSLYLPASWRASAIGMGGVGAAIQMGVITCMGIPALFILSAVLPSFDWRLVILRVVVLLLFLLTVCIIVARIPSTRKVWHEFVTALHRLGLHGVGEVAWWTIMRYIIFCGQFWLILKFVGVSLSLQQACLAIPTYYILVTFTPSFNLTELAVRGSWAVVALSPYTTTTPSIILAAWLIWVINSIFPLLIGLVMKQTNPADCVAPLE